MRIALFEDDLDLALTMSSLLRHNGYEVVLVCHTMARVREVLEVGADGSLTGGLEFDIAIVDGNLSFGTSGKDGVEICELLSHMRPRPYIIGNSGAGAVIGADIQSLKDISRLLQILSEHKTG